MDWATILNKNGLELEHAPKSIRDNKKFVLMAIRQNGCALHYADKYWSNREVVLVAISQCGLALSFATFELQVDREILSIAISNYGCAILFTSIKLQSDYKLAAVISDEWAFLHLPDNIRRNKDFIVNATKANPKLLPLLVCMKKDLDIIMPMLDRKSTLAILANNEYAIMHVSKNFSDDVLFIMEACKLNPRLAILLHPYKSAEWIYHTYKISF